MGLITKSDCLSVTDLDQTFRYIGYVVYLCSKLHKDFHDYCLFSVSNQLVVGIVFSCFWLKNHNKIVLRYSLIIKQYFYVEKSVTQLTKNGLNAQQQSLHDCKIPQQFCESWQINCVFRLFSVCVYKSWSLSTSRHTKWFRHESQFENQRLWSHITHFFLLW